jgi:site-specific DNA recombinase
MSDNGDRQKRVATYARVSTQEQASEGTSLDFQQSQLAEYCRLQGWTVVNSYVDPGFSGKDGNRPGLERLLSDAKIGLFDKVVVYKLDRLARNLRLLLDVEQKFRGYRTALISMKESVDTSTGTGKMVFQMFGMIAEWEREAIIERTKNGRLQRYREGCWAGGKAPYGYAYDKETRKLVIDESEARIVRRIYSEYSEGKTLYAICEALNQDKVPGRGKNCKGWRQTAVRQVLLNPIYKGTQIVNRHAHISDINKIDLSKAIRISVPALVTEQVWQSAQERLRNNKHVKPNKQGEYLLQGIITCGVCGYAYRAERVNATRYYLCRGRMKSYHLDGSPRCKTPCFKAESLENEVWKRIEEIINDPNRLFLVIKDTIENLRLAEADLSARIKPIDERLAEIAEQKAKLADDWIVRHMNGDRFKELKAGLDREEARMKAVRVEIDPAQIEELENTRGILSFWEGQIKSMAWNTENEDGSMVRLVDGPHRAALKMVGFEDGDLSKSAGFPTSRRQLLDKLQVKLAVFNDRIEVKALFPVKPVNVQLCTSTRRGGLRG